MSQIIGSASMQVTAEQIIANQDVIREQAAYWLLEDSSDDILQAEQLQHWLAKSSQHQQIFSEMQSLWSAVNPQNEAGKRRTNRSKRSKKRQQVGVASLCVGALFLGTQLPWQYWGADYRTGVGQVTSITLADGSSATLNTNSAINVYYQHGQRKLQLVRGEVFVEVKKQANLAHINLNNLAKLNRFTVTTPQATAQALGTRYSVKYSPNTLLNAFQGDYQDNYQSNSQGKAQESTQVTVFESKVQVSSTYSDEVVILSEGQQATVTSGSTSANSPINSPVSIKQSTFTLDNYAQAPDWSTQRLSFNKTALSSVIARLNQYHQGILFLSDDKQLNARQFTGVLPTNDISMAIDLLAQSMDLQINSLSPYVIWLENSNNNKQVEDN